MYIVITLENDQQTVTIPILKEGKQLKANAVNTIAVNNLKLSDNSCEWYEPVETRFIGRRMGLWRVQLSVDEYFYQWREQYDERESTW